MTGSIEKTVALEMMSIMGAAIGLISGGIFVRLRSQKSQDESESNPILYEVGNISGVLAGAS